jgi:hypothetical protein
MEFNAELISFKLMNSTGTLRLSFDVPENSVPAVMSVITNYLKQPLILGLAIDTNIAERKGNMISKDQIAYIHVLIKDISDKFEQATDVVKTSCKEKFLGSSDISTKDLTSQQAEEYIKRLKALKELPSGNK